MLGRDITRDAPPFVVGIHDETPTVTTRQGLHNAFNGPKRFKLLRLIKQSPRRRLSHFIDIVPGPKTDRRNAAIDHTGQPVGVSASVVRIRNRLADGKRGPHAAIRINYSAHGGWLFSPAPKLSDDTVSTKAAKLPTDRGAVTDFHGQLVDQTAEMFDCAEIVQKKTRAPEFKGESVIQHVVSPQP